MKVLVVGGTGFMGQNIVPLLKEKGYDVTILARDEKKVHELFGNQFDYILGDIADASTIDGCCDDMDIVINLAALMGHDLPSEEAFAKFRKVNVQGLENLVSEAKKANVVRFIHISSTAAMGLQNQVVLDENTICKPFTPYQVTKFEGEKILIDAYNDYSFPAVILRPSMVYGPGFKGDFLTIAKVCKYGVFPKIGFGKNLSPALYISDLAEMVVRFIECGRNGEVYLVSSSKSFELADEVHIIGKALNKKVHMVLCPRFLAVFGASILEKFFTIIGKKPLVTKRNILSVSQDRIIDTSKMREAIGYEAKVEIEEGLTNTISYFVGEKYI